MNESKFAKRLKVGVILLIALTVCLCVTTFALVYSTLAVDNNLFQTGTVDIDLNGGVPIVKENEFRLYPGATVEKEFYLQNNSSDSVYYRLFFKNVDGSLADDVEITILWGEKTLYSGKANGLSRDQVDAADDILRIGEKRFLTAVFHLPEEAKNAEQNGFLCFDLCAEAVQSKNNPDRNFD